MGVDGGVAFGLHGAEQMLATNTAIKQLRKR
jgi:hypothetical protein